MGDTETLISVNHPVAEYGSTSNAFAKMPNPANNTANSNNNDTNNSENYGKTCHKIFFDYLKKFTFCIFKRKFFFVFIHKW